MTYCVKTWLLSASSDLSCAVAHRRSPLPLPLAASCRVEARNHSMQVQQSLSSVVADSMHEEYHSGATFA